MILRNRVQIWWPLLGHGEGAFPPVSAPLKCLCRSLYSIHIDQRGLSHVHAHYQGQRVYCARVSVDNGATGTRHTAMFEIPPATIHPLYTCQPPAASPILSIGVMKESWHVANVLVTIGTGCRAQAAVYRTNRKGSRCPWELKKSLLPLWNIDVRRTGRRRQIHWH